MASGSRALRSLVRLATRCLVLTALLLPASNAASQATPDAAPAGAGLAAIAEARQAAVPLGEAGAIGPLQVVVDAYTPDASALARTEGSGVRTRANQHLVNVTMTLTNAGDTEFQFAQILSDVIFYFAGNRNILYTTYAGYCEVDADLRSTDTPPLAPGASAQVNFCLPFYTEDLDSLQMLAIANAEADRETLFSDRVASGTWFDLGAPEPYDPNVAATQVEAASAIAPDETATFANPHSDVTTTGSLVVELLDYQPDVTAAIAADERGYIDPEPGNVYAQASMRATNVGDRAITLRAFLVGDTGFGPSFGYSTIGEEDVTGIMLPGGWISVTSLWDVPPSTGRALAVSGFEPGSPTSWLLPDPASPLAWDSPAIVTADAAPGPGSAEGAPYGSTAATGPVAVTLAPGQTDFPDRFFAYQLTATSVDSDPAGRPVQIQVGPVGGGPCDFLSGYFMPGASTTTSVSCVNDIPESVPLEMVVTDLLSGDEVTGTYSRENYVPGASAGTAPQDDPSATEATGDPATDATEAPAGDGTATVVANANVRAQPSTTAGIVAVAAPGDTVTITGDPVDAEGYTWYPVTTADGTAGWIASQLLDLP